MRQVYFLSFILAVTAISLNSSAQVLTKPNPELHSALQKVINDVPNQLQNLSGEMISEDGQSTSYACKIRIPGSINTIVTSYHSVKDKSRSLQATILETENFDEARKKYNELVNQLKAGKYRTPGEKTGFKWNVNYDKPDESKDFAASIFRPVGANDRFKNLKLEVAIHSQLTSFTVNLFVYEKVEDDKVVVEDVSGQ